MTDDSGRREPFFNVDRVPTGKCVYCGRWVRGGQICEKSPKPLALFCAEACPVHDAVRCVHNALDCEACAWVGGRPREYASASCVCKAPREVSS